MANEGERLINPWNQFIGAFVPNWLLCRPEIQAGAKLAYARLCQFAGRKGVAFPKMKTLARELAISEAQAQRYVAELRDHGLIQVELRQAAGLPSLYRFRDHPWMFADPASEEDPDITDDGTPTSHVRSPPPHVRGHPDLMDGVTREESQLKENQGRDSEKMGPASQGPLASEVLGDGGPSASTTADDRDARLRAAEAQSIAQTAAAHAAKVERRVVRGAHDLLERARTEPEPKKARGGKKTGKPAEVEPWRRDEIEVEDHYRQALKAKFPQLVIGEWTGKERGQLKTLLKQYPLDLVKKGISYAVENWESLSSRMGVSGSPTLGILMGFGNTIFTETQGFSFGDKSAEQKTGRMRGEFDEKSAERSPVIGWAKRK
jgi:hypothetical protein